MWRTPTGDRILTGAEAELFRVGLASLLFYLDEGEDIEMPLNVGVSLFDGLTYPQKLAMLEFVGGALLRESIACPKHTAVGEATIAAVFYHIESELEVEIDEGHDDIRRLIVAACKHAGATEQPPRLQSISKNEWRFAIEFLTDQILWDCDWGHELGSMDAAPEVAQGIKDFARIDDDYYTAIAPDPTPEQLRRIRSNLRELAPSSTDEHAT